MIERAAAIAVSERDERAIDLRMLDRHPLASFGTLVLGLRCGVRHRCRSSLGCMCCRIEDYMATWETFFGSSGEPATFHFTDVEITAGSEVAFVTAVGHGVTADKAGQPEPLDFRLTMGLRKSSVGRWIITHEHHSLPAV